MPEIDGPDPVPVERTGVPAAPIAGPVPAYNYRAVQALWFLVGLVDVLLAIRFFLKLLGASTASAFVTFLYGITAPLIAPFQGIFGTPAAGGSIVEPATLVAIVVYSLIGWGIAYLIRLITAPRGTRPVN
ncbi:MAG: YggT family protein [Candidatus Dormibacteraeota bacterium]|nr:YggT family protein [Candidatus Dormibacteraeota bacterium]